MLVAEDGLVLGAVVGEKPLHVADAGAELHVYQEYDHFQHALGEVAYNVVCGQGLYEAHDKGGQEDEQQQGQGYAQHHGGADYQLLGLFGGEVVAYPLVQLVRLGLLILGIRLAE